MIPSDIFTLAVLGRNGSYLCLAKNIALDYILLLKLPLCNLGKCKDEDSEDNFSEDNFNRLI